MDKLFNMTRFSPTMGTLTIQRPEILWLLWMVITGNIFSVLWNAKGIVNVIESKKD